MNKRQRKKRMWLYIRPRDRKYWRSLDEQYALVDVDFMQAKFSFQEYAR